MNKYRNELIQNNATVIQFDKANAVQVRDTLLNAYGFDLTNESFIGYTFDKFRFTVMGFRPTTQYDTLIATVKIALDPHVQDEYTNVQKIDLYNNERLNQYCRTSAFQLKANEADIAKALYSLRERLESYRRDELKKQYTPDIKPAITEKERVTAMNYLQSDNLMDCIEGLLQQAGVVTEMEKALQLFFVLLSRHFDKPLHVLFQGSTQLSRMLMDTVTATIPKQDIHEHTSMSPGSLYYTIQKDYWKGKILHLKSIDKQFKGASTIKEFIDNGVLKRYTTENEYITKHLCSKSKVVEGAICLLAYCEDETVTNKFFQECFLVRVEENEKNRVDMLTHFKKESVGLINQQQKNEAIKQLINIQQLIKPLRVVIPYAMELELPAGVSQQLRDFPQLLTFIKSVALLHQHQLTKRIDENGVHYIEATTDHLQIALELFKSILITKTDILTPAQRGFTERLKTLIHEKEKEFKVSEVLKLMNISKTTFYREFDSIKELGYVVCCGGNKKTGIRYRIEIWDDYTGLQDEAAKWNEKLSFPSFPQKSEVSHKFPKTKKSLKQA